MLRRKIFASQGRIEAFVQEDQELNDIIEIKKIIKRHTRAMYLGDLPLAILYEAESCCKDLAASV